MEFWKTIKKTLFLIKCPIHQHPSNFIEIYYEQSKKAIRKMFVIILKALKMSSLMCVDKYKVLHPG